MRGYRRNAGALAEHADPETAVLYPGGVLLEGQSSEAWHRLLNSGERHVTIRRRRRNLAPDRCGSAVSNCVRYFEPTFHKFCGETVRGFLNRHGSGRVPSGRA